MANPANVTLGQLQERQTEIRSRLEEIDRQAAGDMFSDTQAEEWNALNTELESNAKHVQELQARQARIEDLAKAGSVEQADAPERRGFKKSRVPDDPSDLVAYRNSAGNVNELMSAYQEGALRINERMTSLNYDVDLEATQERMEKLLKSSDDPQERALAQRVIATSTPTYERAFGKKLMGSNLTQEEERALGLTTTAGGYAVPVTLDPTLILTNAGYVNPIRQLARTETITGNTWYGVSTTGITAGYAAEFTEASDNSPTLVQPTANVEKAQAFIPFSIEIGQDWANFTAEMSRLFLDAKNNLENTKFLTGLGHTSSEPQGLIAVGGATAVVVTATTATIAVGDIYNLESALSPRNRANASIVGNRAFFQKVRQLDTAGGANLWTQLGNKTPSELLGYPVYEWSAYASTTTTSGSTVATMGDFSRFLIIDRVGMDVELIPHLFATANNRPYGARALYCYWRNTSQVMTPGLLANSAFVSLKVL